MAQTAWYEKKNATFSDLLKVVRKIRTCREALDCFKQSSRLILVLHLYLKIIEAQNRQEDVSPDQVNKEEAKQLAKKHKEGKGFVTKIGFNELANDEGRLKKALHKFLLANHPDKNPEGDVERIQDANNLLNMIKEGNYLNYRRELERLRNS